MYLLSPPLPAHTVCLLLDQLVLTTTCTSAQPDPSPSRHPSPSPAPAHGGLSAPWSAVLRRWQAHSSPMNKQLSMATYCVLAVSKLICTDLKPCCLMVFITIYAVSIDIFSVIFVGGQINVILCVCAYTRYVSAGPTHYFRAGGGGGLAPHRYMYT